MTKLIWHSGPPPSIGWWPASLNKKPDSIRWHDGKDWSIAAFPWFSVNVASESAKIKSNCQHAIKWTTRPASWPLRSRT